MAGRSRRRSRPRESDWRLNLLLTGVVALAGGVVFVAVEVLMVVVRRVSFPFFDPSSSVFEPVLATVLALLAAVVIASRERAPLPQRLFLACLAVIPLTALGVWGAHVVNGALDPGPPTRVPYRLAEYWRARGGTRAELVPLAPVAGAPRLSVDAAVVGEDLRLGTVIGVEVRPGRLGRPWIAGYHVTAPR